MTRISPAMPLERQKAEHADRMRSLDAGNNVRWPVSRVLSISVAGDWMTIHLGHPSPDASCNQPGRRPEAPCCQWLAPSQPAVPIRSCSRWGLPCQRRCRRRGALLPHRFTLARAEAQAVCSLWHCPWGRPRRALPGTVSPWSPDFPPPRPKARQRSSSHLTRRAYAAACRRSMPQPSRTAPDRCGTGPGRRWKCRFGIRPGRRRGG